jgi:hypothetical protein
MEAAAASGRHAISPPSAWGSSSAMPQEGLQACPVAYLPLLVPSAQVGAAQAVQVARPANAAQQHALQGGTARAQRGGTSVSCSGVQLSMSPGRCSERNTDRKGVTRSFMPCTYPLAGCLHARKGRGRARHSTAPPLHRHIGTAGLLGGCCASVATSLRWTCHWMVDDLLPLLFDSTQCVSAGCAGAPV